MTLDVDEVSAGCARRVCVADVADVVDMSRHGTTRHRREGGRIEWTEDRMNASHSIRVEVRASQSQSEKRGTGNYGAAEERLSTELLSEHWLSAELLSKHWLSAELLPEHSMNSRTCSKPDRRSEAPHPIAVLPTACART